MVGGCVRFVAAPGGAGVTLLDGVLAFATDRYPTWPVGVGFSDDDLWAVGETASGWALDRWDPSSGSLGAEFPLDGFGPCADLITDAVGGRVYVACWLEEADFPRDRWPALLVFEEEGPTLEAVMETVIDGPALRPRPPYQLILDPSAGRVALVTVWDGTTAPVERGVMGVSFDLLD